MSGFSPYLIDLQGFILQDATGDVKLTNTMDGVDKGFRLDFDLLTVPKYFSINPTGVYWSDGVNTYSTSLEDLALVQTVFAAVTVPPNSTTLEVNKRLALDDQLGNIGTIGINGSNTEITSTNDLILNPVGSIDCNGNNLSLGGGEIHNCPLVHSQNNQNIRVEGKGSGSVILKTNNVDRLTITSTGTSTFSTPTTINQSTTGGIANPLLTLNQNDTASGSAGIRIYKNSSTTGSTIGDLGFIAKTALTGNPEREYARISGDIRSNSTGNVDGSISLRARVNDTLTELMRINGQDNQIEAFQTLDMNNNSISAVNTMTANTANIGTGVIQTAYNFYDVNYKYVPQRNMPLVYPVTAFDTPNAPIPLPLNGAELIAWNNSIPDANRLIPFANPAPSGIYCSIIRSGYLYVGAGQDLIKYEYGSGTWTTIYSFNGLIRCLALMYRTDDIYIGGDFTLGSDLMFTFNYIAVCNTEDNVSQVNWRNRSATGFNQAVLTFAASTNYNVIYVGGNFTATDNTNYFLNYVGMFDSNNNLFAIDDNSGGTNGTNAPVHALQLWDDYRLVIGGQFSSITCSPGMVWNQTNISYCLVWNCFAGSYNTNPSPNDAEYFGSNALSFNNTVESITKNPSTGELIIGGYFNNWDSGGIAYNIGFPYLSFNSPNDYSTSLPIIKVFVKNGERYWTDNMGYFFWEGNASNSIGSYYIYAMEFSGNFVGVELFGTSYPYAWYFYTGNTTTLISASQNIYNGSSNYTQVSFPNFGDNVQLLLDQPNSRWIVLNSKNAIFS